MKPGYGTLHQFKMKIIKILPSFLLLWCHVRARCLMRGFCTVIDGSPLNCPVDIEPPPMLEGLSPELREQVIHQLTIRCPEYILDENGNQKPDNEILTCCDHNQLHEMYQGLILLDGILGRCPSCTRNFVTHICEMSCSPDQARFIDVHTNITADGIEYVEATDYRLHEDYMDDTHASCAGVIVPQTGLPAINLLCGDAPVCTPQALFDFSGDTENNPLAVVQINFLRWPTLEDSMHAETKPCNETYYNDLPCSCIDCVETCPTGVEPVPPEVCTVLNVNCIGFSIGIVIIVLTIIIIAFLSRRDYINAKNEEAEEQIPNPKSHTGAKINRTTKILQFIFSKIGSFSASNPFLMITLNSWLVFAMYFGVIRINLTTNPLELWSAPETRGRIQLNYYNSRFGPFYRTAQVFMQFNGLSSFEFNNLTYGPAYRLEAIEELIKLEDAVINIGRDISGVVLEDVCFSPMLAPGADVNLDYCVVLSASSYLGDDRNNINNNTYLSQIQSCLNNHFTLACLASWGGASEPEAALGGYEYDNILTADTLLLSFPLNNHLIEEDLRPVLEFESKFIELLQDYEANWKPDFVDVSFYAERSMEDEIIRVSVLELVPILISYILMLVYVMFALGNIRSWKTCFLDNKIVVAISSVVMVLAAIFCALGVVGFLGITMTLLAVNVVPFFVLSIGVDNVFLMINALEVLKHRLKEFEDYDENFSFEKKRAFLFGKMMGQVAPSFFVSSVTQITCFAVGTLSEFPAVINFAAFIAITLGFLFIFQLTSIVAILSLDYKRAYQNRYDVACCIRQKIDSDINNKPYKSIIAKLMVPYSKFLLKWWVKMCVVLVFVGMFCGSLMLAPSLEIGLDEQMAVPPDSYVYKYLTSVFELLRIGPPVFFVLKSGLNFSDPDHQNVICGGQLCNEDSLTTQIFLAAQYPDITHISRSSNSWLDDFFDWTSMYGACCKYNVTDGSFCRSADTSPECVFCDIPRGEWQNGLRPSDEAFQKYIPFFLLDDATESCNKGGLASYSVNYLLDSEGLSSVHDTSFMAYHTVLTSSADYINAVRYGYEVSDNITAAIQQHTGLDVEVFPYSIFYPFYEQYLSMWSATFAAIGFSLIGAMILNLLVSGFNFLTTFAVVCTTIMVVVDLMGVMYLWGIQLNPVACINLLVSIGISVEFCSHIAYAFTTSPCPKDERITDALRSVGPTIITGITFTNIPIVVLAFSYTEIIRVFFFKMLFSIIVLGFLHGMIFFPVLLSYLSDLKFRRK